MTAPVAFTRTTYGINDTLEPADFNAQSAVSATVRDAAAGQSGVMPDTTTAAGLAMVIAANVAAQRTLLGLGTADSPTFAGMTLNGVLSAAVASGERSLRYDQEGVVSVKNRTSDSAWASQFGFQAASSSALMAGFGAFGGNKNSVSYCYVGPAYNSTWAEFSATGGKIAAGFGCNGATPQTAYASGGTLAGVVAALVACGILSN